MIWGCDHQNNKYPPIPRMEEVEGNSESLQSRGMCFPHSFQTTQDGCKPIICAKSNIFLQALLVEKQSLFQNELIQNSH